MTPDMLILTGILLVLVVAAWQLVLTLRQARRTAEALERFLEEARPSFLGTVQHLRSLLGRADRLMAAAEEGTRISSNLSHALSILTVLAAGLQRVWDLFVRQSPRREGAGEAAGGAAP